MVHYQNMKRRREIDYQPNPKKGKPQVHVGDLRIFQPLNRYKLLTTSAIALLSGMPQYRGSPLQHRLTRLRHDGPLLGAIDNEGLGPKCQDLVYYLNENGAKKLRELGVEPTYHSWMRGPNEHDFATSMMVASLEIYASKFGLEFISFDYYAERSELDNPFLYRDVQIKWTGQSFVEKEFTPDYPSFGFRLPNGDILHVSGFETDRGTETKNPSTLNHSSVARHMLSYVELDRTEQFHKRFKLKGNFHVVPILTWSRTGMQNIMNLVKKTGGDDLYVFGVVPNFARFFLRSKPTDELFTGLVRADGSPFNIQHPEG
jgi:hypothetical protein